MSRVQYSESCVQFTKIVRTVNCDVNFRIKDHRMPLNKKDIVTGLALTSLVFLQMGRCWGRRPKTFPALRAQASRRSFSYRGLSRDRV